MTGTFFFKLVFYWFVLSDDSTHCDGYTGGYTVYTFVLKFVFCLFRWYNQSGGAAHDVPVGDPC